MSRLPFLSLPLLIAVYLYALWTDWFTTADINAVTKRPLYSENLDIRNVGPIVWEIAPERLGFAHGKAQLSLSLNVLTMLEIPEHREAVALRVKIVAQGRPPNGVWEDRLIRDGYYKTDEPFSREGSGLWERWGWGRTEFGLAGVEVVSGEELRITVDVQVPDGMLMSGGPRLKLVSTQHPLDPGVPSLMRIALRDGGFWLSLILLLWLSFCGWRGQKPSPLTNAVHGIPA